MSKNKNVFLLVVGAIFFFVLGGIFWPRNKTEIDSSPKPAVESFQVSVTPPLAPESELVKVFRVVDGDTIILENGRTVRYIGIDTPETRGDCFANEATNKNKELVEGKMVRMEKDVSETDRYNRLLRYIYLDDTFINDKLVRDGYAKVSTYPPDVKYQQKFLESEKSARESDLGLWSRCRDTSSKTPEVRSYSTPEVGMGVGNIECSTNTYNCSSFKTQAEAQNVFDTCGGASNDVHKLDRDGDGRVCESLP